MKPERWRQIEHLYNQALEMEESRRTAFLREACAGDDDLRHVIEKLLEEPGSFLEEPALQEIAHEFAATPATSWVGRRSATISLCRWPAPGAWAKSIARAIRS